jgi:serine kinase of HPr protein (carbohydrate metabolism regulator)
MKLQKIVDTLSLEVLTNMEDRDVAGVFISDMLSDVMGNALPGNLWLTVQSHKNVVSAANLVDVAAVVVTNGKKVPEDTIELAKRFHVIILASQLSTYELAKKLVQVGVE